MISEYWIESEVLGLGCERPVVLIENCQSVGGICYLQMYYGSVLKILHKAGACLFRMQAMTSQKTVADLQSHYPFRFHN
jgi:hypothetical protein